MSKPRIAILFSGQPRCVDGIAYASFKTCILDRYEVDVYAHFWADTEHGKSSGSTELNIQRFKELYKPKAMTIDLPLTVGEYPLALVQKHCPMTVTPENMMSLPYDKGWAAWVRNCVSMYESMKRVYKVFTDNAHVRYDWIIRTRTDCVLLRCPVLDVLDKQYMYAPNWHGDRNPVIVNHALIVTPEIAPVLFSIRDSVETLPGSMDEHFVYNHMQQANMLNRVRTLPMSTFYPTITRNGVTTDKPEPTLRSEIATPPYYLMPAPRP